MAMCIKLYSRVIGMANAKVISQQQTLLSQIDGMYMQIHSVMCMKVYATSMLVLPRLYKAFIQNLQAGHVNLSTKHT